MIYGSDNWEYYDNMRILLDHMQLKNSPTERHSGAIQPSKPPVFMRWKIQLLATHIWWEHSSLDSHFSELFQLFGVNRVSALSISSQLKGSNPSFAELFPLIRLEAPLAVTAPPQRRSLRSPPQGIETSGGTHDTKQIVGYIRTRNLWVFLVSGNFMVEWDFDGILPTNNGDLQDFSMGVYWDLTSKHAQCQNGDVRQFSVSKIGIWMYLHLTGRINQVCFKCRPALFWFPNPTIWNVSRGFFSSEKCCFSGVDSLKLSEATWEF